MKKGLRLFLLGLVGLFSCFSFCSAGSYTFSGIATSTTGIPNMFPPQLGNNTNMSVHCYINSLVSSCDGGGIVLSTKFGFGFLYGSNNYGVFTNQSKPDTTYTINCGDDMSLTYDYDFSTFSPSQDYYKPYNGIYIFNFPSLWIHSSFQFSYSCTFSGVSVIDGNNYSNSSSSCPEVNTGEILSGYILESSIDTNYCVGNGYCPTNECTGSIDPVQSGNWSSLFINDIQHIGAGLINITIPEEIDWDYVYTGNGEEFDLDVKGYNVDSDYIEGIINTQNSKPNTQDFNNIITGLIPLFVPGLCIILLIYFIYLFIKKIF